MSSVGYTKITSFLNMAYVKMHIVGFTGFYIGCKTCDYFLFDDNKYELIREEMEDEFWKTHGEPVHIKPHIVASCDPDKEDVMRKSWISIIYEKDKWVPKVEDSKMNFGESTEK